LGTMTGTMEVVIPQRNDGYWRISGRPAAMPSAGAG
jgi:hypothetical protein